MTLSGLSSTHFYNVLKGGCGYLETIELHYGITGFSVFRILTILWTKSQDIPGALILTDSFFNLPLAS